jgi:hypothetical protein
MNADATRIAADMRNRRRAALQRLDQTKTRPMDSTFKCGKFKFTIPFHEAPSDAFPRRGNCVFARRKILFADALHMPIQIIHRWAPALPIDMIRFSIASQPVCANDSVGSRNCHFIRWLMSLIKPRRMDRMRTVPCNVEKRRIRSSAFMASLLLQL